MKNRKRIMVIASAVVIVIIYVLAVYRVNHNARKAVYKYYDRNEVCEYKDGSIEILDSQIYDMKDFREKYSVDRLAYYGRMEDESMKCVVTKARITRLKETKADDYSNKLSMENGMYTRENHYEEIDMELFDVLNPDYNYDSLKKGESVEVLIPACMLEIHFREKDWKNIWERPMYITYSDYEGHEYISRLRVN